MKQIKHSFFPLGATVYVLPDKSVAFIYPSEDSLSGFNAWYTGLPEMNEQELNKFLDECAEGEHDTLGSGFCDTWANVMEQLQDFSN